MSNQPSAAPPKRFPGPADILSVAALALLGASIYGWVGLHAKTAVTFSDSMDYVMIADFYRAIFRGEIPSPETIFHYRLTRFPPLFPMLLGALGGGSEHQHLASVISLFFSATAPIMAWTWIRRESESTAAATVVAAALMVYPAYFLLSLSPVSEPFAMFLCAIALYLTAKRPPESSGWAVAALLIGVALLARTALLPLAISLVLVATARRARWSRLCFLTFLAFAPLAIWSLYRRSLGATGYSGFLTGEALVKELGGFPDALWLQPARLLVAAHGNWSPTSEALAWLVTGIIALLVAIGTVVRMRQWTLDSWFLSGYVAMILLWPYPFELGRFLVVVYPVCLLAAMEGGQWLASRLPHPPPATRPWLPVLLLLLAGGAPATFTFAARASVPVDPSLLDDKRESFFFIAPTSEMAIEHAEVFLRARLLLRNIADHVPEGECVYSNMPQFVALYGKRDSSRLPPGLENESEARETLTACRYFFLADIDIATYDVPGMYPAALIESWTRLRMVSNVDGKGTVAALLEVSEPDKP